jgi:HD-GYP domain-containing protein (c-di-GMP phosphodiesterase class II)
MSVEQALEELERCAGTQFDPRVVAALVAVLADRRRRALAS